MRRNVYAALASQWLSATIAIGSAIFITRMMQPAELGVYSVAVALTAILGALQIALATELLLYADKADLDTRRLIFALTIAFTAAGGGVLWLGGDMMTRLFGDPDVVVVVRIVAVQMVFWALLSPSHAMLVRLERFDLISMCVLMQNISLSLAQIVFVWRGYSYIGLAYAWVLSGFVALISYFIVARRHFLMMPSLKGIRSIGGRGGKTFFASALQQANSSLPVLMIGNVFNVAASALYNRANVIGQIYSQTIGRAIDPVISSRIAADGRDENGAVSAFVTSSTIMLTLSAAFFGFAALAAPVFVPLVFGAQWSAAAGLMQAVALALVIWPITAPASAVLLALQRPGLLARIRLINLVVRIGAILLLAPLGLQAVAWGIAASSYANFAQLMVALRGHAGLQLAPYLGRLANSLLTTAGPLAATYFAMRLLETVLLPWLLLLCLMGIMTVALFVALAMLRHPLWDEIRFLLNKLRITAA